MTALDKAALATFTTMFIAGISVAAWGAWDMMALSRPRKRRSK